MHLQNTQVRLRQRKCESDRCFGTVRLLTQEDYSDNSVTQHAKQTAHLYHCMRIVCLPLVRSVYKQTLAEKLKMAGRCMYKSQLLLRKKNSKNSCCMMLALSGSLIERYSS